MTKACGLPKRSVYRNFPSTTNPRGLLKPPKCTMRRDGLFPYSQVLGLHRQGSKVEKLVVAFYHRTLKVVELIMELDHESLKIARLAWRPHHMEFHTCMSWWVENFTKKSSES